MDAYVIGGSPCSGKSTVAETLAERYGLQYFKVDDHLARYMQLGAAEGKPCCAKAAGMSPEENWMREPQVQCEEELLIYGEIFPYVMADLASCRRPVITEGAAYLPSLAASCGIPAGRYIAVTPAKDFQNAQYSLRPWVPHVLAGCSDKAQAFANWMDRDALFAEDVRRQCAALGYASLINRGEISIEEITNMIAAHFGLNDHP